MSALSTSVTSDSWDSSTPDSLTYLLMRGETVKPAACAGHRQAKRKAPKRARQLVRACLLGVGRSAQELASRCTQIGQHGREGAASLTVLSLR